MADARVTPEFREVARIGGKGSAAHQFEEALRGIAVDGDDRLYAVGDSSVKVFDAKGELLRRWTTGRPGYSVAVDGGGRIWIGESEQVEIYGPQGELADTWRDSDRLGLVTAIGLHGDNVFLADAAARCIRRYDRTGRFLNNIGDRHRRGGFLIPNGVVDFDIDGQGIIHVANPGMHRVERYTPEGRLLGRFGRFDGQDPEGFPGCCNPTNLTLDGAGRVIVTEKAGPRAKVMDPEGRLIAVVADDVFDANVKNMDVAIDSRGRIHVVDTVKLEIFVFSAEVER